MFHKKERLSIGFWLTIILSVVIFISLVTGVVISFQTGLVLDAKIVEAEEMDRPADFDIISLKESSCKDCFNIQLIIDEIKKENVKVNSEKTIEVTSAEGMELVKKFNILRVPTFIITGEIEKEASLKAVWPSMGEVKDDTFIFRQAGAPYVLVASGDVRGRVDLTMLMDRSCAECYDVTAHEAILEKNFGVFVQDSEVIDSGSGKGKELIRKYQIKLLPTIILTGDTEVYQGIQAVWPKVGTVEEDGVHIFREGVKQMGAYKDLAANKIINPMTDQK